MATIRERIAKVLLGPEYNKLNVLAESLVDAYERRPVTMPGNAGEIFEALRETIDPRSLDLMIRQLEYSEIGYTSRGEPLRLSIVKDSRQQRAFDPIAQFAIELWTDYGFSSRPTITTQDPAAQNDWLSFWNSTANQYLFSEREIQDLSNNLLTDGELFFVFFSARVDGITTCRVIPTEQIKDIITLPDDKTIPVFYKREYVPAKGEPATIYYRDWRASPAQVKEVRDTLPEGSIFADVDELSATGTDVVILHAAFRKIDKRGWPLMAAGMDWSRAYRGFLQDRAAVAKAAATFPEKIKAKGAGQRAVDMIQARIQSSLTNPNTAFEKNPVPAAGSTWIENDAISREWMNRPTYSADAEKDGIPLLTNAGLAAKLYPHYLGRGDYYRLATASALEGPILKSFNRYQAFWSSLWSDMVKIVLGALQEYGGKNYKTLESKTSLENILSPDLDNAATASQSLIDFFDRGLIAGPEAEMAARELLKAELQAIGIDGSGAPAANPITPPAGEKGGGENDDEFPFLSFLRVRQRTGGR